MTKIESALKLARQGFRVFPLVPNEKTPAIEAFPIKATTDEAQIHKWWSQRPDYNIGISTGDDLVVIDYDMKEGQHGRESLALHEAFDLPETFRVDTPNGVHLYFRPEKSVPNSRSLIGEHVDVRGLGGYVVGPGSTTSNGAYTARAGDGDEKIVSTLPDWLEMAALTPKQTALKKVEGPAAIALDLPEQLKRADIYIRDEAPEAIEGHGGDETTYRVACKLHELGLSRQTALEYMVKWNFHKATPPWHIDDLSQKVDNAFKYAKLPAGITAGVSEFTPVQLSDSESNRRLHIVSFKDGIAKALTLSNKPLIEDVLDAGTTSVTYGRSNSGKTFVQLDIDTHIATGRPWNGHRVESGPVLYVAAEGSGGIFKRIHALHLAKKINDMPLGIVPCPIDLLHGSGPDSDTQQLIDLVKRFEDQTGRAIAKITIDTLSRALAGGDENSSVDMGTFIKHIDKLRAKTSAHISIVHHTGKDIAKGARGWSGMQAAIDTEIEIHENILTITKQRDLEPRSPLRFDLTSVEVGKNIRGKTITSCVVRWRDADEFTVALTPNQEAMLDTLKELLAEADAKFVTTEEWETAWAARPDTGGTAPRYMRVLRQALVAAKVVTKNSRNQWSLGGSAAA